MSRHRLLVLYVAVSVAGLALASCGGSPTSPSGTSSGVSVEGVVLGLASGVTAQSDSTKAASDTITVTVKEDPSISVTVSGNGTFVLTGLPEGTFTLVFSRNGTVLGEVTVTGATDGVKVKIVVQVSGVTIILVDLQMEHDNGGSDNDANKACMISGGRTNDRIELEGSVASVNGAGFELNVDGNRASGPVTVITNGASFKCNGNKGNSDCKAQVTAGAKVHVRGTLTSCTQSKAEVVATEVMVQKAAN